MANQNFSLLFIFCGLCCLCGLFECRFVEWEELSERISRRGRRSYPGLISAVILQLDTLTDVVNGNLYLARYASNDQYGGVTWSLHCATKQLLLLCEADSAGCFVRLFYRDANNQILPLPIKPPTLDHSFAVSTFFITSPTTTGGFSDINGNEVQFTYQGGNVANLPCDVSVCALDSASSEFPDTTVFWSSHKVPFPDFYDLSDSERCEISSPTSPTAPFSGDTAGQNLVYDDGFVISTTPCHHQFLHDSDCFSQYCPPSPSPSPSPSPFFSSSPSPSPSPSPPPPPVNPGSVSFVNNQGPLDFGFLEATYDLSELPSGTNSFTLETWVKSDFPAIYDSNYLTSPVMISRYDQGPGFYFQIHNSNAPNGKLYMALSYAGDSIVVENEDLSLNFFDNQWHHVAFVRDSSVPELRLYRDGVPIASTITWNKCGILCDITAGLGANLPLGIGNAGRAASRMQNSMFLGLLDEVRVWTVARTDAEILANYDSSINGSVAGLARCYHFDETDPSQFVDCTPSPSPRTLVRQGISRLESAQILEPANVALVQSSTDAPVF